MELQSTNNDATAWKIELMADSGGTNVHFGGRQKYLDVLMVRSFGFPERAVLEGQFGTKAEAGEHADLTISLISEDLNTFIGQLNWHLVNRWLRFNYGEQFENAIFIKAEPIVDTDRVFFRELYKALITGELSSEELDRVDNQSLRDRLGVPTAANPGGRGSR